MPKPHIYKEGQPISDAKILRIQPGDTISRNQYLILYPCCGTKMWVGHKCVAHLAKRETVMCISCAHKISSKRYWEQHKPREINQIFIYGWGWTLGRMGMRGS